MIDATETPPTFSTNPPRSIHEKGFKKAEFRAYMLGAESNIAAWEALCGRELFDSEREEVEELLVAANNAEGNGSYATRPKGVGNMVIGVLKGSTDTPALFQALKNIKTQGGKTALIAIGQPEDLKELRRQGVKNCVDAHLILEACFKDDYLGIISTVMLKQVLNMISNGAMISMDKVWGNIMIDILPSNYKLIDRTIRILQMIYQDENPGAAPLDNQALFEQIREAHAYRKQLENEQGIRAPAVIKIVKLMIAHQCSASQAFKILLERPTN